jgi:hypothetical protein
MRIGADLTGLSLLLPLALIASILVVRCLAIRVTHAPNTFGAWMAAAAGGYVLYLASGLVAAEVLGAFNALTRLPLACWWLSFTIVGFTAAVVLRPTHRRRNRSAPRRPPISVISAVAGFALIVGFLFWLGVVAAPDNLDAMNYHLTMAAHWATNHNVNDYPTTIAQQTYNGRLAEYFSTQVLILDGTDRLVFLPQFLAYLMASVLVAGLARQLGGGRRAALWGLLLAGTMPLALMQATTAQNDLVVASVILVAYYLVIVLFQLDRISVPVLLLIGAAAGMAIVTKADAVLALVPLGLVLAVTAWRRRWVSSVRVRWVALAVVVCVALTLPMTLRNWQLYHDPEGPSSGLNVTSLNPLGLATTAVQSGLLNVDTLDYTLNTHIVDVESSIGRTLGWDHVNPQFSTSASWPVVTATPTEEGSGDLVAYLALLAAALLLVVPAVRSRVFRAGNDLAPTILASGAALILILTLLKWQPWGARFQLMALYPLLACAAVILAAVRGRVLITLLCTMLIGLSLVLTPVALLRDNGKPVFGDPADYLALPRDTQYFRWCPGLQHPYTVAVHEVLKDHQTSLGYVSRYADIEYPLWALLSEGANGAPVHVVPLQVMNPSSRLETHPVVPPTVALVSGSTIADEMSKGAQIRRLGYREQSLDASPCGVEGIYVRPS